MKNLSGKNAVLTGGSSGIGPHIARALAIEGVNVAIVHFKSWNVCEEGFDISQELIILENPTFQRGRGMAGWEWKSIKQKGERVHGRTRRKEGRRTGREENEEG